MFGDKKLQPENLQPNEETRNVEKKEGGIKNTAEFEAAIESDLLDEAENFLESVKSNRELFKQYDDRWIDHRERELFKAYCGKEDWSSAKRIVDGSISANSKEGRKKRLADLAGAKYEEIA